MDLAPRRTSLLAVAPRGLARRSAARPGAMIAVLLAAACARTPAPRSHPSPSTRIAFFRATRAAAIPRALRQAATGAGLRGPCAFAWGMVASGGEARRTDLLLGDAPLPGWIVCAGALRSLTRGPPTARLEWHDGALRAGSPDGSWRPVTADELAARWRGRAGAGSYALFSLRPTDKVTAARLAPTLVRLAAALRSVLWELPAP